MIDQNQIFFRAKADKAELINRLLGEKNGVFNLTLCNLKIVALLMCKPLTQNDFITSNLSKEIKTIKKVCKCESELNE